MRQNPCPNHGHILSEPWAIHIVSWASNLKKKSLKYLFFLYYFVRIN